MLVHIRTHKLDILPFEEGAAIVKLSIEVCFKDRILLYYVCALWKQIVLHMIFATISLNSQILILQII